jgi:hypothetical protein
MREVMLLEEVKILMKLVEEVLQHLHTPTTLRASS